MEDRGLCVPQGMAKEQGLRGQENQVLILFLILKIKFKKDNLALTSLKSYRSKTFLSL